MITSKWSSLDSEIDLLLKQGLTPTEIALLIGERMNLGFNDTESLRKRASKLRIEMTRDREQYNTEDIQTDKKIGYLNWRDVIKPVQELQQIFTDATGSQDYATWKIKTKKPICVAVIGDLQLGSWATDYNLFLQITEEILNTPNLYIILVGDLLQMAIKLQQGVLAANDNAIPPKYQLYLLDSWLQEVKHKIIASTWDNHSVMREEVAVGYSGYAEIFKRHTIFHNHIGHLDIQVNDIVYKWGVTHFFPGRSILNPCHAPMRYMRHQAPYLDVVAQGDFHVPGKIKYWEGGKEHVAIVCGSIQTDSGYAKRLFSLTTAPVYPCVVLDNESKIMTDYWSICEWLKAKA